MRERIRTAASDGRIGASDLYAQLEREDVEVSKRQVQRIFAEFQEALATDDSGQWHFTDATSREELDLVLPVLASRIAMGREGIDARITKTEAQILVAVRRAAPDWTPWQADLWARYYRATRDGEWPDGDPRHPDQMEGFLALVHLNRTEPGVLAKAIAAERVPAYGWLKASEPAPEEASSAKKRAGGSARGKTRTR